MTVYVVKSKDGVDRWAVSEWPTPSLTPLGVGEDPYQGAMTIEYVSFLVTSHDVRNGRYCKVIRHVTHAQDIDDREKGRVVACGPENVPVVELMALCKDSFEFTGYCPNAALSGRIVRSKRS